MALIVSFARIRPHPVYIYKLPRVKIRRSTFLNYTLFAGLLVADFRSHSYEFSICTKDWDMTWLFF